MSGLIDRLKAMFRGPMSDDEFTRVLAEVIHEHTYLDESDSADAAEAVVGAIRDPSQLTAARERLREEDEAERIRRARAEADRLEHEAIIAKATVTMWFKRPGAPKDVATWLDGQKPRGGIATLSEDVTLEAGEDCRLGDCLIKLDFFSSPQRRRQGLAFVDPTDAVEFMLVWGEHVEVSE